MFLWNISQLSSSLLVLFWFSKTNQWHLPALVLQIIPANSPWKTKRPSFQGFDIFSQDFFFNYISNFLWSSHSRHRPITDSATGTQHKPTSAGMNVFVGSGSVSSRSVQMCYKSSDQLGREEKEKTDSTLPQKSRNLPNTSNWCKKESASNIKHFQTLKSMFYLKLCFCFCRPCCCVSLSELAPRLPCQFFFTVWHSFCCEILASLHWVIVSVNALVPQCKWLHSVKSLALKNHSSVPQFKVLLCFFILLCF